VRASFAGNTNYAPKYADKTISIAKADAQISITPYSGTYDGNAHGISGSATGVGGVNLSANLSFGATFTNVPGGSAHWTFAGGTNYNDASGDAAVTIGKAPSSTTVSALTVPYDGASHATAAVVAGVGTGITQNVTWTYSGNCSAEPVNVAHTPCTAKATYAGDGNHDGSSGSNTITITPLTLNAVIIGNPTKTYDGNANATLASANYSLSGFIASQSATVTKTSGTYNSANVSTANTVNVTLAPADFTAGASTLLGNYTLPTTATGAAHIGPSALTYVADAKSRTFGAAEPGFTGNVTGFVNSESVAGATTGTLTFATTATQTTSVGNHPINGSGLTANYGNYTFAQALGNATALSITQAQPTVTITWNNSTYDNTANSATAQVTGVLSGPDVLSPPASLAYYSGSTASGSALAGAPVNAGTYTVRASFGGNTNYVTKFADKTITIDKATSTTTVSALTATFDGLPHPTTAVVSGVGTQITQTVTWTYSGNCSAAPVSVADTPCSAKATYAGDGNHYGSFGSNTITITKATPAITWNTPADINWPTALGSTQLNAAVYGAGATPSVLSGASTYTPASSTVLTPGTHQALVVNFVPVDNVNYTNATKTVYLNVIDATKPIVTNTLATPNPLAVGTPSSTVTATISDVTTGGSNISSACFRIDGGACQSMTAAPGNSFGQPTVNVTGTYTFPAEQLADVIELCVYGTDSWGNTNLKLDCSLIALYDPKNGFVTGGGWIMSPEGAYVADPTLVGKATFGFVSKYQPGKSVPQGNTEFQFHVANFNFKSTVYEWLVVAGARAQFKGSGTINGSGDYGFLLTAIDGQINGGGGEDKFRIKIVNKATGAVVYDNNMGMDDTGNPTTLLGNAGQGGGSIMIQQK
jgi:hypothetical protein